jgi:exopolyphosphatase/guanosine-5'-triphosphate,3'-diphosphate pyrophosphatase
MVLAEVEPDYSYKILDRIKDMTRLGDGTFNRGRLPNTAVVRGVEVLRGFTNLARNKGFERIVATATSAVREAKNGGEFLKTVLKETGLRVQVVTGQEEARLIYLGVRHSMELADSPSLIVDVGGGSVELIACNNEKMLFGKSLKLGAIRLADKFLRNDPPSKAKIKSMEDAISKDLHSIFKNSRVKSFHQIVATSGMAANLAEVIYLERTGRPLPQINLARIDLKEIRAVEGQLKKRSLSSRLTIAGLDPKRVDTLLPASIVLRSLLEHTKLDEVTISDKAIREGVIYDFIARHKEGIRAEHEIPNVRRRYVILLGRRCGFPEDHSCHVAKLALSLFDQLQPVHGLGEQEREWLDYAALLHDVGYLINVRQHHKHSYYLITHGDLSALSAEEIEIIANIARYHRRALPRSSHLTFKTLPLKQRKTVEKLSAILRIADGLDRSHFSVVQNLRVQKGTPLSISLECVGDPEFEMWAAQNRADLFEKVFDKKLKFVVHTVNGQEP